MSRRIRRQPVAPDLTFRSFQALETMRRCTSTSDLNAVAATAFSDIGTPWFSLARFYEADGTPATKVMTGRFEPRWSDRYVRRNYARSSTIARRLLTTVDTYTWADVIGDDCEKTTSGGDQQRLLSEARDFGLEDGLFTPLRWTDRSYAAVVLAGDAKGVADPLNRMIAEVISSYYAHEARRLLHEERPLQTTLTQRQRDCLQWVRHGKSSVDIAELLGISAQTVEEHIAGACRRLGVRTRIQATVEAVLLGLI